MHLWDGNSLTNFSILILLNAAIFEPEIDELLAQLMYVLLISCTGVAVIIL